VASNNFPDKKALALYLMTQKEINKLPLFCRLLCEKVTFSLHTGLSLSS
jgi:hypothetical protein